MIMNTHPISRLVFTVLFTFAAITSGACSRSTDSPASESVSAPAAVTGEPGPAPAESSTAPGTTPEAKEAVVVEATASKKDDPDKVVVYYFHFTRRCRTCLGIQKTIADTLQDRFAEELAAGTLVFEEINLDEDQHKHFMKEFELGFSSMIVAARKGDSVVKWVNSDKIWEHAHNTPVLASYVEEQILPFLATL
jgi:hypothetical protein